MSRVPVPYGYIRSLEFEGRHPDDVGQWGITSMRLEYLEGLPDFDEYLLSASDTGVFPNTPDALRTAFWPRRRRFYRRIRSANEAAHVLNVMKQRPIQLSKACLPLFASWVNPADGAIPMPVPGERAAPETHAIRLLNYFSLDGITIDGETDAHHFLFENSWGEDWGRNGRAMLPFAYYNKYVFEHYVGYDIPDLTRFQTKKLKPGWRRWQAHDEFDRRLYAFEAGDPERERLGWAFAVESDDAIEVEELFVAPGARRQGIGRTLADYIVQLAAAKSLPIRLWVSFADTVQESPDTAGALASLAKRMRLRFYQSPVPWAAYFAASSRTGSETPVEPAHMPGRPKSTMGALVAFAASVGVAMSAPTPPPAGNPPTVVLRKQQLTLDSPEWATKNARRAALIRKKNREGLAPAEWAEFEDLQLTARALVEAASPRPALVADALEAKLAEKARQ